MAKRSRRTREQIRVVVIPVDGPARSRQIVCEVEVLGDLTGRCGGFEVYPVRGGPTPAWAYVSGEGSLRGQRPNPRASTLLGMPIVGPVVIVGEFTPDGNDQSAPDWVIERLGRRDPAIRLPTVPTAARALCDELDFVGRVMANVPTFVAPARVGRNAPCPCGSGKKHKRCCGRGTT